jgi:hypothetical protein
VLSTTLSIGDTTNVNVSGWVDFFNPSSRAIKVTVSFYRAPKGGVRTIHKENEIAKVGPHSHVTVTTGIQDDTITPGSWEFGVLIKPSASITVASASQTVLAMGPNMPSAFATRTASNGLALNTKPTTVLTAIVDSGSGGAAPRVVIDDGGYTAQGWLNVVNGQSKTTVALDYYMDDAYMGSVSQIIGPEQPVVIPFGFLCNGVSGQHTFTVTARTLIGSAVARSGFMSVAQLPDDGSMLFAAEDEAGQPTTLTTKPQQLLTTKLGLSQTSDVWMGGWLTLENMASKKRIVTVQAAMGGESEGPAVLVTIPPHGRIGVSFGLLCDGEDAGDLVLDVLLTASGSGVEWTGDGHLGAWALPEAP